MSHVSKILSRDNLSHLVVPLAVVIVLVVLLLAIIPASRVGLGVSALIVADAQGVPPHAGALQGSQPGFDWNCAFTVIGWTQSCYESTCGGGCTNYGDEGMCIAWEPITTCTQCESVPIYPTYEQCVIGGWRCDSGYNLSPLLYRNLGNDGNAQWWQCNSN